MSLTRKLLKGMSLTDEQVETIISEHTETVNGIKKDIDELTEENEKLKEDVGKKEKDIKKVQKELDTLKEATNDGEDNLYEKKYNEVKEEFDKFKANIEEEKKQQKKDETYRKLLKESGISEKRVESVLKLAKVDGKLDSLEYDDKGEIKNADKLKEDIKTEYSEYVQKDVKLGTGTSTPPQGTGGSGNGISRASKLAQEYHSNLYGESKKE